MIDLYFVYKFVKRLVTSFEKWELFKLGVIDAKGELLVKVQDMTKAQRDEYSVFNRLTMRIKKIIEKIPGVNSKLATYAAALFLIKETNLLSGNELLESELSIDFDEEALIAYIKETTTSGAISAATDGTSLSQKAQKKHVDKNSTDKDDTDIEILRRVARPRKRNPAKI